MCESWRNIDGFPGYRVSDQGRVRDAKGDIVPDFVYLQTYRVRDEGYRCVRLYRQGSVVGCMRKVYLLVAQAFCKGGGAGMVVHHLDGDKTNDRANNLRWMRKGEHARLHSTLRGMGADSV